VRKKKTIKYLKAFLKIAIAILAIWILFKTEKISRESFIKLFQAKNIPFLFLSGLAFVSSQLLATLRLVLLLRAIGFRIRYSFGFRLTMIGNFFSMVIPGTVGGDIVKGYYLMNKEGNNKGRSSGIIIMDRVLGFFAIVFFAIVAIIYLFQKDIVKLDSYHRELDFIIITISSLFGLFVAFLVFGRNQLFRRKLKTIFLAIFRNNILYYIAEGFGLILKKPRTVIFSFIISLLVQLISFAGLLILVNISSVNMLGIIPLFAVISVVKIFGAIPVTPGNIGWIELIAAFGFSVVGSNTGAEIFLYWRLVAVVCSLSGLYLFMAQRREQAPKNRNYTTLEPG
jgi:glycosyltransferase 2 family protein